MRLYILALIGIFLVAPITGFAGWETQTVTDEMTDETTTYVRNGRLVVMCQQGMWPHLDLYIASQPLGWDEAHGQISNFEQATYHVIPLQYRFDQAKVRSVDMSFDINSRMIHACPGFGKDCSKTMIRKLYAANTFKLRSEGRSGGAFVSKVIDLTEGRDHLLTLMESCKVKPKQFKGLGGPTELASNFTHLRH